MRLTSTFIINMGKNNAWQGPYNFSVHRPVTYWPPQRALRGFEGGLLGKTTNKRHVCHLKRSELVSPNRDQNKMRAQKVNFYTRYS